jgi:RNA polymerase sigma-70 factor (ECF subfamily)
VGRLLDIFIAEGGRRPPEEDDETWEGALATLCAEGEAKHPSFGLGAAMFVAHLARCGAPLEAGAVRAHAADLYLACACLASNAVALASLRAVGRPVLVRYLSRIQGAHAMIDEIEQRLWDAVLVGSPPKLASYAGRGPLGAWLGVTAQRFALMELRHERAERRARTEVALHDRVFAESPELATIKRRFRAEFQRAVRGALETLDDRQRLLYRMHIVDGVTLDAIARIYKVHAVTVGRWLTAAHQQVLDETKRRLKKELPLDSDEFESLARMLVSGLDLDPSRSPKSS